MKNKIIALHQAGFLLFFVPLLADAQTPFSLDSAVSYLKTISVEIGPRPMGSPNERKAMEFAVQRFKQFGFEEAYVMPMMSVEGDALAGSTNTNSGIAVGVLKGTSDRIILIGGHIDSAGPDIPGTNDDGSGSATVIELARVLSKRKNESTLVFCLFGGEEAGLRGSKHFVKNFHLLNKVALMLQIDMTNGSDWLVPLVDASGKSAPKWLVSAAYEEYAKLGYTGLSYPTHFLTLSNSLPGGGIGSDHMPFLEKNIPAIDFTSDITDPIHTAQDNFENFKISGLKRSGDLVYKLIERFDSGVPKETVESYYLLQVGSFLFFVPLWLISGAIVVSIVVAGYSLFQLRKIRTEVDRTTRPKIPSLKLFLILLIIQTFVWFSELTVGLLKGVRYPWFSDPSGYFILAGLAALVGVWVGLQLSPRMDLSRDPYRYSLRACIWLVALTGVFSLLSGKLALYPSAALLLTALATIVKRPLWKVSLWILSPFMMYRLFFNDGFALFARIVPEGSIESGVGFSIFWNAFLILFFTLWSFPFLVSFAGISSSSGTDFFWLKKFRQKTGLVLSGLGFLVCAVWLSTKPTYSNLWKQAIRVDGKFESGTGPGSVTVRSTDYLSGTHVKLATWDTILTGWNRSCKITDVGSLPEPWVGVLRNIEASKIDSSTRFNIMATISMKHRPSSVTLTYSSTHHQLKNPVSALTATTTSRTISLRWAAFPDTVILAPLEFTVVGADSVTESIEAMFTEPLLPVKVEKELSAVNTRTLIRQSVTVRPPRK